MDPIDPRLRAAESGVRVDSPTRPKDLAAFLEVYRHAFRYRETGLNVRLMRTIQRNGGVVLGAWVADVPVGFVFGFVGHAPDVGFYHFSQMAAVADRFQGQGIGRTLKLAQRQRVLAQGLRRMRWYFDPMRTRNAHFNLNVLGARAIGLERDLYGPGSGRDLGFATNRLVAEWRLDESPATATASGGEAGQELEIAVPAEWDAYRSANADASQVAERAADALAAEFDRGFQAVALRRSGDSARYVLIRLRTPEET